MINREITSRTKLMELSQLLLLEEYQLEETIFDEGQVGDRFYIILTGQVRVDKPKMTKIPEDEQRRRQLLYDSKTNSIEWAKDGIINQEARIEEIRNLISKW